MNYPWPLPVTVEDRDSDISETQSPESLMVSSSISLCAAPQSLEGALEEETTLATKQTPLRDLLIRYTIEVQVSRRIRSLPTEQVDITAVATKSFDWGTE